MQLKVAHLSRRLGELKLQPAVPSSSTYASRTCRDNDYNNIFRVNLHKRNLKKYEIDQQKLIAIIENSSKQYFKITEKQCLNCLRMPTCSKKVQKLTKTFQRLSNSAISVEVALQVYRI